MPNKPPRPCNYPGCKELTNKTYCPIHEKLVNQKYEKGRETATARGYGTRWQKASKIYLRNHPLCAACYDRGNIKQAKEVDHIIPHKGDYDLFWNESNWQSLCKSCHSKKTATEDGGFGHTISSR